MFCRAARLCVMQQRWYCSSPSLSQPKPYNDIPRKRSLPFIGTTWDYLGKDVRYKPFKVQLSRFKEMGPIFREKPSFIFPEFVMVSDPNDIETVLRSDGKFGNRTRLIIWEDVRTLKNIPFGLFLSSEYEDWYRQRQPISQFMMVPRKVGEYHEAFNEIANDMIKSIKLLRDPQSNIFYDVPNLLFKWSFESISYFVLGKRMGCLDSGVPIAKHHQEFIDNVQEFISVSQDLLFGLPLYKVFPTKSWKRLEKSQVKINDIAKSYIEEKIKEIKSSANLSNQPQKSVDFLTYMILSGQLSVEEASINAMDLLGAGIDTTSYTLVWCLYELANDPEVQSKLKKEVDIVIGQDEVVTLEHIHNLPYLRQCIKETQRLYPVAPNNSRILNEDVVLSGYSVPKGACVVMPLYTLGRLPHLFPEPEKFKPERWSRSSEDHPHRFASLPFGFGPRMCVGRRVAEIELHIGLAQIMKSFNIGFPEELAIEAVQKLFTVPERKLNLSFQDVINT